MADNLPISPNRESETMANPPPIRIVIVDDHPLLRQGVALALRSDPRMDVVGEGSSGQAAVALAVDLQPDILLLDISMPDGGGLEAAQRIRELAPRCKIAMLTASEEGEDLITALRAGVQGYILKGSQIREVVDAVLTIHAGHAYVSPQLAGKLLLAISAAPQPSAVQSLTDRELGILRLVAEGLPNKEIAARLDLAEKTVKHHMTALMRKLGVTNRVEAALLAQRDGLT